MIKTIFLVLLRRNRGVAIHEILFELIMLKFIYSLCSDMSTRDDNMSQDQAVWVLCLQAAAMADEAAVAQFTEVTGASKEAAKFFLDSSGGELGAAIEQFFATGGEFEAGGDAPAMEDEELLDDDEPEHPVVPGACACHHRAAAHRSALIMICPKNNASVSSDRMREAPGHLGAWY